MYSYRSRHFAPPETARDRKLSRLSLVAQLLWHRLHSDAADDQGRFVADPDHVKLTCAPLVETITPGDLVEALQELIDIRYVILYQTDGEWVGQVIDWWSYQTGSVASPSALPAPAGWEDAYRTRQSGIGPKRGYETLNWPPKRTYGTDYRQRCPQLMVSGRSQDSPRRSTEQSSTEQSSTGHSSTGHSSTGHSSTGHSTAGQLTVDAMTTSSPAFATELAKIRQAPGPRALTVAKGGIELAGLNPDEQAALVDAVKLRHQELEDA